MSLRNIFIENLRFYRKNASLSQLQLAEKCNIATNYLSEIERGQKFPSVELIEKISYELNIPAYLLFLNDITASNTELITKKRDNDFSKRLINTITELLKEYKFSD